MAQITINPAENLQAKINACAPGDTVFFADGAHTASQLTLKSGVKYTGNWTWDTVTKDGVAMAVPVCKATLTIVTGKGTAQQTTKDAFALVCPDANNGITIEGLNLRANSGVVWLGSNFKNAKIVHNDIQFGYDGQYYNRLCFKAPGGGDGLTIEENYIHDSESSDRNFEIFGVSNFSHAYNIFYRINDVGHWMNCTSGRHSYNFGRLIHRMGAEMQQDRWPGPSQSPFEVVGNVFYDWREPYWDSMLMSLPTYSTGILIENNYLRGNAWQGKWGQADSSGTVRGSYSMECPQGPAGGQIVRKNIVGGERMVGHFVRPGGNADCTDNRTFGPATWYGNAPVGNEPGSAPRDGKNTGNTNQPLDQMPAPPRQPRPSGQPVPPDPIPTPGPTMNLTATAFKTYADLVLDFTGSVGTTALERRASDNVWLVLTTWPAGQTDTAKPFKDTQFSADQIANKWRFWYRLRDKNGSTPDVVAQIGVNPDPTTPPPGAPTTTEHTLEFSTIVEGQSVKVVRAVKVTAVGNRTVEAK